MVLSWTKGEYRIRLGERQKQRQQNEMKVYTFKNIYGNTNLRERINAIKTYKMIEKKSFLFDFQSIGGRGAGTL